MESSPLFLIPVYSKIYQCNYQYCAVVDVVAVPSCQHLLCCLWLCYHSDVYYLDILSCPFTAMCYDGRERAVRVLNCAKNGLKCAVVDVLGLFQHLHTISCAL